MTDDIVTRLRTVDEFSDAVKIMDEAADEIERLREQLKMSKHECQMADDAMKQLRNTLGDTLNEREYWKSAATGDA